MRVYRASSREVGSCNFCTERLFSVFVLGSDRGFEARICDVCWKTLCQAMKYVGYELTRKVSLPDKSTQRSSVTKPKRRSE